MQTVWDAVLRACVQCTLYILIHKVRKIFKNEKNVILHFWPKKFEGAFWNAQTNATIHRQFEDKFENAQWRKAKQMQPMRLCLLSCRPFEATFENTQCRKAKQMRPMWFFILWGRQFDATFKNAQWRKIKQMQSMWLCLFSCRQFEDTFENAQWRKVK